MMFRSCGEPVLPRSGLVGSIMSRRVTALDKLGELFSTHPNIVKRLRALNG